MTKILVATDGSAHAEAAAAAANQLFGSADFIVMTVAHAATVPTMLPYPVMPLGVDPFPIEAREDLEEHIRLQAERIVSDTASIFGAGAERVVDWGPTGRTICDRARLSDIDVIVLGDHGHGWLGDRLLGSVARYVVHHTPCGVYIHRDHPSESDG